MPKKHQLDTKDLFEEIYEKQIHDFSSKSINDKDHQENIFELAKQLDQKYDYILKVAKERNDIKLEVLQKRNQELQDSLISDRKQLIEAEMENIEQEIKNNVKNQTEINNRIMIELETSYQENKDKILKKIYKLLEFDFM